MFLSTPHSYHTLLSFVLLSPPRYQCYQHANVVTIMRTCHDLDVISSISAILTNILFIVIVIVVIIHHQHEQVRPRTLFFQFVTTNVYICTYLRQRWRQSCRWIVLAWKPQSPRGLRHYPHHGTSYCSQCRHRRRSRLNKATKHKIYTRVCILLQLLYICERRYNQIHVINEQSILLSHTDTDSWLHPPQSNRTSAMFHLALWQDFTTQMTIEVPVSVSKLYVA